MNALLATVRTRAPHWAYHLFGGVSATSCAAFWVLIGVAGHAAWTVRGPHPIPDSALMGLLWLLLAACGFAIVGLVCGELSTQIRVRLNQRAFVAWVAGQSLGDAGGAR